VPFEVIDTGGMFGASEDPLHQVVLERGRRAMHAPICSCWSWTAARAGAGDHEIAEAIRAANKPALLAINKTDDRRAKAASWISTSSGSIR